MELKPHQQAAVDRLREVILHTNSLDQVPQDEAEVCLESEGHYPAAIGDTEPLMLGHLRDLLSIFPAEG